MIGKFIIFRLEKTKQAGEIRMFLTGAFTWSKLDSKASKGTFNAMKSIAEKIKDQYPDLIIERQGGSGNIAP